MDAVNAILTRASIGPKFLGEPAPEGEDLETILAAGARAPDHGKLRHWRFILIRGGARERLGHVFAEALRCRDPDHTEQLIKKELDRPLQSPLMVVVVARVDTEHPKIPEIEQLLSAGAAAQNILLTAHALGFGAKWVTGGNAYDPFVWKTLGLAPPERIIGFIYLGTAKAPPPPLKRPDPASLIEEWSGPAEPPSAPGGPAG